MDKEKFIAEAKSKRRDNIEKLTGEVLAKMLGDDLRYFDAHYIQNRTQEILERTIQKLKFESKDIEKARRAFLDVLLDGAKKQLFGFDDDYDMAKKKLKIKAEKAGAIQVLRKIERLRNKTPEGKTEERDMQCEPVCQFIAGTLLSKETILSDEQFVNDCIEMDNELLLTTLYRVLFDELFDQLVNSLDKSYILANEKNWGVPRHEIKLSQIDNRLKSRS